jgi:uncharacterized membrane protein YqiK
MTEFLIRLAVTLLPVLIYLTWWVWRSSRERAVWLAEVEAESAAWWKEFDRKSAEYRAEQERQEAEWKAESERRVAEFERRTAAFEAGEPLPDEDEEPDDQTIHPPVTGTT